MLWNNEPFFGVIFFSFFVFFFAGFAHRINNSTWFNENTQLCLISHTKPSNTPKSVKSSSRLANGNWRSLWEKRLLLDLIRGEFFCWCNFLLQKIRNQKQPESLEVGTRFLFDFLMISISL